MGYSNIKELVYNHDMRVEPGKTYRYRLRVRVLNPLFAKRRLGKEQRQGIGRKFLLTSDWSDWSDPIEISGLKRFLFAKASTTSRQTEIHVRRFTLGQTHSEVFKVRPGDEIGGVAPKQVIWAGQERKIPVDFSTGAILVDLNPRFRILKGGRASKTIAFVYLINGRLKLRRLDQDQQKLEQLESESDGGGDLKFNPEAAAAPAPQPR